MTIDTDWWCGKRVMVTGGVGFIGSHVVALLAEHGACVTVTARMPIQPTPFAPVAQGNATRYICPIDLTRIEDCMVVCRNQDVVFNFAHVDGSTAYKSARPSFIFRQNMLITLNMLEAARLQKVERLVLTSSAEVYPPDAPSPTPEMEGLSGLPDELTRGYAWSKRMSDLVGDLYAHEYGMQVLTARPSNIYGPGDYIDVQRGRVVPMLLKQIYEGKRTLTIWGTGKQLRSFLYVQDLARGLLDLARIAPTCGPINFAGAEEVTIKALTELIVRLTGREVELVCDLSKPSGPQRRVCDVTKAQQVLGFQSHVPLEAGLTETVRFFYEHHFADGRMNELSLG